MYIYILYKRENNSCILKLGKIKVTSVNKDLLNYETRERPWSFCRPCR